MQDPRRVIFLAACLALPTIARAAGHDATMTGAAYNTTAPILGSADLSGGYGVASTGLTAPGFTVEFRMRGSAKPRSATAMISLTDGDGVYGAGYIGTNGNGDPLCETITASGGQVADASATTNIYDGAAHAIACVVGASGVSLYIDGVRVGQSTANIGVWPTSIGIKAGSDGSAPWSGEMDEVVVTPTVLYTGASYAVRTKPYAGTEGMNVLLHLDGSGADSSGTASAPPSSTTIASGDAAIYYSPYNWWRGETINPGAYFRMTFTGSSLALNFDVSTDQTPFPQIWVTIDGQPKQSYTLASTVTPTMPANTAAWAHHTLEVVLKSTSEFVPRWSTRSATMRLTSITLAGGATASTPTARSCNILAEGDSITEGYHTINGNSGTSAGNYDTDGSDATLGWAFMMGAKLGCEVGVVGFGGASLTNDYTGEGGVPRFATSFPAFWNGQQTRFVNGKLTPSPDLVIMNYGGNDRSVADASVQAAYVSALNAILAASSSTTKVVALKPFAGNTSAPYAAAVASIGDSRLTYVDLTSYFNLADSVDATHPLGSANTTVIAPMLANSAAPLLRATTGGGGGRSVTHF